MVRKGEVGDALFMLNRGVCELQAPPVGAGGGGPGGAEGGGTLSRRASSEFDPQWTTPTTLTEDPPESAYVPVRSGPWTQVTPVGGSSSSATKAAGGPIRLTQGDAFGETSLLINYKRVSSVRAVTFVEMCVLPRDEFQRLLARYHHDRRQVLTAIVAASIAKGELPFAHDSVCTLLAQLDRGISGAAANDEPRRTWTPDQAASLLAEKMDAAHSGDDSIRFGFDRVNDLLAKAASTRATAKDPRCLPREDAAPVSPPMPRATSADVSAAAVTATVTALQADLAAVVGKLDLMASAQSAVRDQLEVLGDVILGLARRQSEGSGPAATPCDTTADAPTGTPTSTTASLTPRRPSLSKTLQKIKSAARRAPPDSPATSHADHEASNASASCPLERPHWGDRNALYEAPPPVVSMNGVRRTVSLNVRPMVGSRRVARPKSPLCSTTTASLLDQLWDGADDKGRARERRRK